jgi:hypothetical protein
MVILYLEEMNNYIDKSIEEYQTNIIRTSRGVCIVKILPKMVFVRACGWLKVKQNKVKISNECVVCFEKIENNASRAILTLFKCSHDICTDCFFQWKERTCPICRKKIEMEPCDFYFPIKAAQLLFNSKISIVLINTILILLV